MEYNSALKRKKIPTYVTTWMNLEDIMLSEESQTQNDTYGVILLVCGMLRTGKFIDRKWNNSSWG